MKTKIIFFVVSFYIFAAFIWWGYSLINLRSMEVTREKESLFHDAHYLKLELLDSVVHINQVNSSIIIYEVFNRMDSMEKFELYIDSSLLKTNTEEAYQIVPKKSVIENLDLFLYKKTMQYAGEGIVFIILLIWGMLVLYKNVQNRIILNQQQNNFILAVTHELKTPVASIKLMLQTLQRRNVSEEYKAEMYEAAIADVERLEGLVENVLITSKIDNYKYEYHLEKLDIVEIIEQLIAKFERLNKKHQKFEFLVEEGSEILADRFAITTAFENLLSNAVKYSPEQATIVVDIKKTTFSTMVIFRDEGQPIPKEERENIFKKFYRLGNENTRNNKGTGLGLYIVNQIIAGHDASIHIEEREDIKGNAFVLEFQNNVSS